MLGETDGVLVGFNVVLPLGIKEGVTVGFEVVFVLSLGLIEGFLVSFPVG